LVVAQNYNKTGETWSQGDFNYDGVVNFADLLIVAQQYNKTLPAPAPALALPAATVTQAPVPATTAVMQQTATPVPAPARPVKRTPFKVIGLIE